MNTSQGSAISQALSRWPILLMAALMLCALASGTAAENALGIPDSEYDALVALYNATDGPNWTNNTNWLTENQPWHGVAVESGHVTGIYLDINELSGPLPAQLGSLSGLRSLYLWNNRISGVIPSEIGSLLDLEGLDLGSNELTGGIPSAIGGLSKLKDCNLDFNRLTGAIPAEIGNLVDLEYLLLNSNKLSGTIPVQMGNLSKLRELMLSSNQLTGPIPNSIINLEWLDPYSSGISYNSLWTDDTAVRSFLAVKAPGWELTQTVPPTDVSAQVVQPGCVVVSWTPILYTAAHGYYEIGVSTTSGGEYIFSPLNRTSSKRTESIVLSDMPTCTPLYIVARTVTPSGDHNQSTLTSKLSEETSVPDPGSDMTIGEAKLLQDGETAIISNVPATMGWLEDATTIKGYIQEWDRSAGIAVRLPASMAPDDDISTLSLTGTMATQDGERYIDVSEIYWAYGKEPDIRPLGIANLTGARGHDFSGMYVKTWGKVIESPTYSGGANPNSFRMSDASGEFTVLRPQGYSEFGGDRLLIPTIDAFIPVRGVCSGILGEKLLYHEPGYEAWRLSSRTSGLEITGYACIEDNFSLATAMEISGPGISGWQPMMPDEDEEWGHVDWRWSWTIPNPLPPAPLEYLFRITENGQSSIYKSWITGFITELPTNLSPASGATVSGPLTFSWTLPSTGGPFESRVTLRSGGASYDFWSKGGIHGSSYTYDGPALSGWYSWRVEVFDRDGNTCLSEWTSFEYSGPPPSPSEAP